MKRLVSIVLLTGLLLSMFSCSDTEVKAPAQTETVTTEAETIEDDYVHDDLPDTDFDGATMNILTTIWYDAPTYIYAENLNGVQYVDLGYAFSESAPLTDLIFLINKTNSNQVISFIEKRAKSLDKLLERINKSFDDIG